MLRRLAALAVLCVACRGNHVAHEDAAPHAREPRSAAPADAAAPHAPERTEHAVWTAVDNRHLAHRIVDGELVIDAGDIGFSRYTRFGLPEPHWHVGATIDGERASVADRLASLELPLAADQAAATQLTLHVHAETKQALTIRVNGKKPARGATVALDPGWQTIAITSGPHAFVAGENQLVFETTGGKGAVALGWLRIGTIHPPGDQDPRVAAKLDAHAETLDLAQGAGLAWYVTIPDGANVVADVPAPCRVEIAARATDDSFAGGVLAGDGARLDLTPLAGKVVRLSLVARDCPRARVAHARITLHGPAPAPLPKAAPPRFVILWVMDALRADKLALFTPGARALAPKLDELAASSTVFRAAATQGTDTPTGHAALWTALYPAAHGTPLLDRARPALAPLVAGAGYSTAGVTAAAGIDAEHGFARGFAEFRNLLGESKVADVVIPAEAVVTLATRQLAAHRDATAFQLVGTVDNMPPMLVHPAGNERAICTPAPQPAEIERMRAFYDTDISYADDQLGKLVAQLKTWGIWDQTMLIVTADHGFEMYEDGRCGTAGSLRESLLHVPLIVHDPARFPAGTVIDEGVETIDVLPSILSAIGVAAPDSLQGAPLEPLAQGEGRGWATASYASMFDLAHALRIGRWKARVAATGIPVIDDVVADPDETKDLAATHPVERRMLTDALGLFLPLRDRWKQASWGNVTAMTPAGATALDDATTR